MYVVVRRRRWLASTIRGVLWLIVITSVLSWLLSAVTGTTWIYILAAVGGPVLLIGAIIAIRGDQRKRH